MKRVHRRTRRTYFIAAAAALGAVLIATPLLVKRVAVGDDTYISFGGKVTIDGEMYSINDAGGGSQLVQLPDSDQYVLLPDEGDDTRQIMVFAPGSRPQAERRNEEPASDIRAVEPVLVYPVIGDLVVRSGPGMQEEALAELYAGQCVTKVGIHGAWAAIEWNGGVAYAFDDYLFEAPAPLPTYASVTMRATEALNVRALPTSRESSAILGELQPDEAVQCTGVIGSWSEILFNGRKAYVFSRYLVEG